MVQTLAKKMISMKNHMGNLERVIENKEHIHLTSVILKSHTS
jgi:hypothetical protein